MKRQRRVQRQLLDGFVAAFESLGRLMILTIGSLSFTQASTNTVKHGFRTLIKLTITESTPQALLQSHQWLTRALQLHRAVMSW